MGASTNRDEDDELSEEEPVSCVRQGQSSSSTLSQPEQLHLSHVLVVPRTSRRNVSSQIIHRATMEYVAMVKTQSREGGVSKYEP